MSRIASGLLAVIVSTHPATAEDVLQSGAYEIEVTLELPFVADTNTRKIEKRCLGSERSVSLGFVVLSDNNPLAKCPASGALQTANTLSFDVICPGVNAARGHAVYILGPDRFRGRIEMKMGGKNMTMTETQVGHRIGDCEALKTH